MKQQQAFYGKEKMLKFLSSSIEGILKHFTCEETIEVHDVDGMVDSQGAAKRFIFFRITAYG